MTGRIDSKQQDFSDSELKKLIELSFFTLDESEFEKLREDLKKTINYIHEMDSFFTSSNSKSTAHSTQNINVFRDDKIVDFESGKIMAGACNPENGFFVVPKVLDLA